MLERRYAFPWEAAGWEEQAAPSETVDGGIVEPCQVVVDIPSSQGVSGQSQHHMLSSVGRSHFVPVGVAYELMPDVLE
ncbi:MAG TPA: hypothetical protein VF190_00640, partial [Rhodothermales bacterium]